mgnify:CR=1 FL=1
MDITDRKRLEQVSITDDLIGLYNRRYFNQTFLEALQPASREPRTMSVAMSVVMLDIDYFKKLNDLYGHQKWDELLKPVAEVLKSQFSAKSNVIFRMGVKSFL